MKRIYFYTIITITLSAFLLLSCSKIIVTEESLTALDPAKIKENLKKADEIARAHNDLDKLREAVKLLSSSRNLEKPDFEIEWRFAKYNYFLGRLTTDEKESDKAFKTGESAGKTAARIAPEKPDGYFWYGANLGEQAKRSPLTKGLGSLDDIRAAMNKVIEIQPNYQGASAFDALGQIELETRLTSGKAEKAVAFLEKGLEYEKENSFLRLHLAKAYLAVNRDDEAKKQLDYVLQMKPNPDYMPEYEESQKEAKKLLETKF